MIYLDAAATTLEKPASVYRAVGRACHDMSSPGRGRYPATCLAEETAFQCRTLAAELFGVPSPEQVVFTYNATHALNIAIRSLVRPGSRVLISGYEHNAVVRPLYAVEGVELTVIDAPLFDGDEMERQWIAALERGVDVAVCTHVSNVFGCVLPVEKIAEHCRHYGVPLIIDASQSAGILPVSLSDWGAAFVAMPGHKGLYGPQGTGLLLCGTDAAPLLYGGTGSASRSSEMPAALPDRLEAGTHNMPGIAGLLEGLRFLQAAPAGSIARHERAMARRAQSHLQKLGAKTYWTEDDTRQTGVLSFAVPNLSCEALGQALGERGIAVRAGLHCAPLAHRTAGTLEKGTVRLSPSRFTTAAQIDRFADAVQAVIRENARF